MKNSKLTICNVTIHPGESTNLALPLPEQYSCAPLYMPIKVLHGEKKGKCLLIFSTITGIEFNGIEIINRLIDSLNVKDIAGTIIAVPVVNVYGLTHYPSVLPAGSNLNHCFPGDEKGTFGQRFAYVFTQEILKKADYCIELQTGGISYNILPQIYCNYNDPEAKKLARIFQTPTITHVELQKNNLRKTTDDLNIPLLVYQAGEALRFDENAINVAVKGIINVMGEIDMIENKAEITLSPIPSKDTEWIIAHKGGVLHVKVILGQKISKNDLLGTITDPFGNEVLEPVQSSYEGIVVGINMTPLIHEGESIFKIASFLDAEKASSVIEQWDKSNQESTANYE